MEYKLQQVNCQNCKNDFTIESEDFVFYEKIKVPPPTFCPECRFERRLTFMNVYNLYKSNCDKCNNSIISMFHKDKDCVVYCSKCWWADDWDGTEYAMDYDPNRNFLEQVQELNKKTPHMALDTLYSSLVNTSYTNYSSYLKNSYGLFFADYSENSFYCDFLNSISDCADCYRIRESELCYQSVGIYKCFKAIYSLECDSCTNIYFSKNLTNCNDCIGCVNLKNKSYCIFNKQYSKEEYLKIINSIDFSSNETILDLKEKSYNFWKQNPNREYYGNSLNVDVSGNYVYESKNAHNVYIGTSIENSKFVQFISVPTTKDAYDYTCWGGNSELIYETLIAGHGASNIKFSIASYPDAFHNEYSIYASSCKNVFGCVNLKRKKYCILNKEYSKEEYEQLRLKIIEDMNNNPYVDSKGRVYKYGEFFPAEFSLFGYNETLASQYFKKNKQEIIDNGFNYFETEINKYNSTIHSKDLPDKRLDLDNITNQVITCDCERTFNITEGELVILNKINFPLPRQCFICRRNKRHSLVNIPVFYKNNCDKCNKEIKTSFNPKDNEIVYCEKCYQQEVY